MEKKKIQIVYIHGGMTFNNREDYLDYLKNRTIYLEEMNFWSGDYLTQQLKDETTIIRPKMPLKECANYDDWKIYFERYLEVLDKEIILVGCSLGGIFLAKYLSENILSKKLISVYLICAPFDNSLDGEDLVGGFELDSDLSLIEKNCNNINLLFSNDDPVVPLSHAEKYQEKLKTAKFTFYDDKNGHFIVGEFPEFVEMIKSDLK